MGPARDSRNDGAWMVRYTTAPPPSNGRLGPFDGVARQVIDLKGGRYVNELSVPPHSWLRAVLNAQWSEWDGVLLLDDKKDVGPSSSSLPADATATATDPDPNVDYAATGWKVDFDDISIFVGGVKLFSKKFSDTSRIWKTTYVDDDTRIVRAGRTGIEGDEFVFYMVRDGS